MEKETAIAKAACQTMEQHHVLCRLSDYISSVALPWKKTTPPAADAKTEEMDRRATDRKCKGPAKMNAGCPPSHILLVLLLCYVEFELSRPFWMN